MTQIVQTILNDEELLVEVSFQWEDCGIGPYECHGYKGNHVDYQPVIGDVTVVEPENRELSEEDYEQVCAELYKNLAFETEDDYYED